MQAGGRSKLFHAIVGIGLATAGCGGRATTEGHEKDAQGQVEDGSSSSEEAAVDAPEDQGFVFVFPDAAAEAAADAGAKDASEVAADVAAEAWHPIPIV